MKHSQLNGVQSASAAANKRRLMLLAAAGGALLALSTLAQAQGAFPSKPIKIVVPYSTGTGSDTLARTIGQNITEKTGHPVIF